MCVYFINLRKPEFEITLRNAALMRTLQTHLNSSKTEVKNYAHGKYTIIALFF